MTTPTLQGALRGGFREAVLAPDINALTIGVFFSRQLPDDFPVRLQGNGSCSTLSSWSCAQTRRYSLDPFHRLSKQGSCLTAIKEDGDDKRLVQLEFVCEVDVAALPNPF